MKIELKVILGFVFSLSLLIVISVVSLKSITLMSHNSELTKHSQEVLTNLSNLLAAITEAESAQRGHVLTNDEMFLETYFHDKSTIERALKKIKILTQSNPDQQQKIIELDPIIDERMDRIENLIKLKRAEGFEIVKKEIATGRGKELQDKIRQIITEMEDIEKELLYERSLKSELSTYHAKVIIVSGILLAILFVITAVAIIFIDFSKRRLLEKEMELKNQRLQNLNLEKDKFFSIIAHDLKSPFNAILGFSEMLVDQVKLKDYEGVDEYANLILQSSQRTFDLLLNLLEWSRAQTGRIEYSPEHFDLCDFVEELTPLFDNVAAQKSILIKRKLPQNMLINADKKMMSTIMRNLVSNAIKFTHQGGEICISARLEQKVILISVGDNGVGIPKRRIEKLFRIDQNNSTPGTANEQGTGLGLILCKEFVEKHGGSIWVESVEGQGSEFCFTLPNG